MTHPLDPSRDRSRLRFYPCSEDPAPASFLVTHSGIAFDPANPRVDQIDLLDIAHALAQQARYAGHASGRISTAEHSVLVSRLVPRPYALWGLLHDAAEAYLNDLPRAVKRLLPDYLPLERRVMACVARRFALESTDGDLPICVRAADDEIAHLESALLARPFDAQTLMAYPHPTGASRHLRVQGLDWEAAKQLFLDRFTEITGDAPALYRASAKDRTPRPEPLDEPVDEPVDAASQGKQGIVV